MTLASVEFKADRRELANLVMERLEASRSDLDAQFASSEAGIGHFYLDDVLPVEIAQAIYAAFPSAEEMTLKNSLRERKLIAAQMNRYNPILEEAIYAFRIRASLFRCEKSAAWRLPIPTNIFMPVEYRR